jgi:hypothetical protein
MGFLDHDEDRYLKRIAEALELIAAYIVSTTTPTARSVSLMAAPSGSVVVGATDTYTATALDANGNVVTGCVVVTASSDDTVLSVSSNGSTDGVETGTWTAVAAGSASLQSTGTNTDGSVVDTGAGNPDSVTVNAPVDLATSVSLA